MSAITEAIKRIEIMRNETKNVISDDKNFSHDPRGLSIALFNLCLKVLKEEAEKEKVSPCEGCDFGRVDLTCANNYHCKHDITLKDLFEPKEATSEDS